MASAEAGVSRGGWGLWRRRGATRGAVIGWLVVLLGGVTGAAALSDNSFLTHLTTGRLLLDGHLPSTDPYSFTAHGHAWTIQSWFASLLYALTYQIGHGLGIRVMVAALSALLAGLLWRLTRPARSIVARAAAVAPAVVLGTIIWGERPLLFGLVGFAVLLLVLHEERDPRWLVPVMWVWVNTHGSFPLALVVVGIYGFGVWCDGGSIRHATRTFGWCVVGILIGGINPLGPKLLWFPVALLQKQKVLHMMIEWQAPSFTSTWERIFLLAFMAAAALAPRLAKGNRYRLLLPALFFSALGFTASRNLALASFLLTPLLAAELADLGSLSSRVRSSTYTAACSLLAVLTVVLVAVRLSAPAFDFSAFPTAAIGWLDSQGRLDPPHRIATRDFVGNYLEFRTKGKTPIFVDDRVDMFPEDVIDAEKTLMGGSGKWEKVLDRWNIDTVLWKKDDSLDTVLSESRSWRRARTFHEPKSSTTWVVYERVDARRS